MKTMRGTRTRTRADEERAPQAEDTAKPGASPSSDAASETSHFPRSRRNADRLRASIAGIGSDDFVAADLVDGTVVQESREMK